VLIAWVRERKHVTRARDGSDRNWHFVPVRTAGPVVITSAIGKLAVAQAAGIEGVSLIKDNGDGSSAYAIDLSAGVQPAAARHAKGRHVR